MRHGDGDLTMAQACGEAEVPLVFYPGENFDPTDPEEREVVRLAMEMEVESLLEATRRDLAEANREINKLRALLGMEEE